MKPGRELDLLVAEKVMGFIARKTSAGESYFEDKEGTLPGYYIPHYSTQISAAWEVVEKMKEEYLWEMAWNHALKAWTCYLNGEGSKSDTAPHSICLAALKAKGVEV